MGPYHRSSLLDHHERIARVDGLSTWTQISLTLPATAARNSFSIFIASSTTARLRVHRLADLDLDVHDLARHRRLEHLATRRGLAAARADDVAGLFLDADMIALAVHLDDGDAVLVVTSTTWDTRRSGATDALRGLPGVDLRDASPTATR